MEPRKGNGVMAKPAKGKERILEIAEAAVLAKGFSATSIEELIAAAGVTKSGFFYHFPDKQALGRELLRRYLQRDEQLLDALFARAGELSEDPLQRLLIGLKLLAELLEDLPEGHPGCLVASFCYQERLFDAETRAMIAEGATRWRTRFQALIDAILAAHPPAEPIDRDALADMLAAQLEGGIVLSKASKEPRILGRQILLLRRCVSLLFQARA